MTAYVANYRKKKDRLERMENDLRRLINQGASEAALLLIALEVRECRIRVLRAMQSQIPERTVDERKQFLQYDQDIKALEAVSASAILAEYLPKK